MDKSAPILVIGAGSVGERHINNLLRLGYTNVHVLRSLNLTMRTVRKEDVTIHTDRSGIKQGDFICAIICNPTALHMETLLWCLEMHMHVLVEKPLSHNLEDIAQAKQIALDKNLVVQVAYMMHYHPHLQKVHAMVQHKTFGNLLHIDTYWGSYLPDWHPWEDHRTSYVALRSLGGGAALTLSHDIDVAHWIAQAAMHHYTKTNNYAGFLQIETEAIADFSITYENFLTAHVHMNIIERPEKRTYTFLFEKAKVCIDFFQKTMIIDDEQGRQENTLLDFDRNDLFIAELEDFIQRIDNETDHRDFTAEQIDTSNTIISMCI